MRRLYYTSGQTVGFFNILLSQNGYAENHAAECVSHIQDKIAWNSDGNKHWEQENLDTLCKAATKPQEPGECFQKVMAGHFEWGAGDKWDWNNAIKLCAGSNNSDERVNCFKGRIKSGESWENAIMQCQTNGSFKNKVE